MSNQILQKTKDWKHFWKKIFTNNFKIDNCLIKENKTTNKKQIIKNIDNSIQPNGYELSIINENTSHGLLLDFDKIDKTNLVDSLKLINCFKNYNLYIEKSYNGGLHIVIPTSFDIVNKYRLIGKIFKFEEYDLNVEIKKNILIYPSHNMKIINYPKYYSDKTYVPMLLDIDNFVYLFSNLLFIMFVDVSRFDNVENLTNEILSKQFYDTIDNDYAFFFNKICSNLSLDVKKVTKPIDNIYLNSFVPHSIINNTSTASKRKITNENNIDFKHIRTSDKNSLYEEDDDENINFDELEGEDDDEEINDENNIDNENSIEENIDLFTPALGENYLRDELSKIDEFMVPEKKGKSKTVSLANTILKLEDPTHVPLKIGEYEISYEEAENYCYRDKLYLEISKNLKYYEPLTYKSLFSSLLHSIENLDSFLNNNNTSCSIFGDHVKIFLEWLCMTDPKAEINMNEVVFNSLFSTLSDFKKWKNWTVSYCRLIIFLELLQSTQGSHTRISIEDYKIYRYITKLNQVGYNHSEDFEFDEYIYWKRQTREKYFIQFSKKGTYFFYFILTTLSVTKLDHLIISNFIEYVVHITTPKLEVQFINRILFDIKFRTIGHFYIKTLYDDSDGGKKKKNAYVWINKLYWQPLDSDFFDNLLKRIFPNSPSKFGITKDLTEFEYKVDEDVKKIELKKWNQIYPFLNGVMDFASDQTGMLTTLKYKFNSLISEEWINNYYTNLKSNCNLYNERIFYKSEFRNFKITDGVTSPLHFEFDYEEYIKTFFNTHLLSLDNHARYSKEFCYFFRSIYGTDVENGIMGPYNYLNMVSTFFNLALGSLRTCHGQNCTIIYSPTGANGKSLFINILSNLFGDKFSQISAGTYFGERDINEQTQNLQESMFCYDAEITTVDSRKFKDRVCGGKITERGIFKSIDRSNNFIYSHYIFGSNIGIHLVKPSNVGNQYEFDDSITRRCFLIKYSNRFLKNSSSLVKSNNINIRDKKVLTRIQNGILYYLLDCIHVFNLNNLSSSITDFISIPFSNMRIVGKNNCYPLKYILTKYVPYTEISNHLNDLDLYKSIDLFEFLKKMDKNIVYQNFSMIVHQLQETFGLRIDTTRFTSTLPDFSNIENENSSGFEGEKNSTVYTLKGLIPKLSLNKDQQLLYLYPNKNLLLKPGNKREDYKTDQEYVESSIPIDQRYNIHDTISKQYFQCIRSLLDGIPIIPLAIPTKNNNYLPFTAEKFLNEYF